LETQVLLSGALNYANNKDLKALKDEIGEVEKMLKELVNSVKNTHLDP
jgi:hypothetical protein